MNLVAKILDEHLENLARTSGPDTFVRLLTLGNMYPEQMKRWIHPVMNNWKENLPRILWFDLHLILSSAKRYDSRRFLKNINSPPIRHFRSLNDLYDLAVERCVQELDQNRPFIHHDILYMTCALYRYGKIKLRLRLNKRLLMSFDHFDPHEISLLFQHVNPDTCNDTELLARIHQKLKRISLANDECRRETNENVRTSLFAISDENDFWPMLNVLTEYINRNIDYYTTEPIGADFILHLRSEIERAKSKQNETWLLRDQYLPILTFYLKYALSGTAIPRNIMLNADAMISQANLKETGTLLAGQFDRRQTRGKRCLLFRILQCRGVDFASGGEHDLSTADRTDSSFDRPT